MSDDAQHQIGMTISFTTDEIAWLAWVVRDVLATHQCVPPGESACDKIMEADNLLAQVASITGTERTQYEKVKTGKLDQRKRANARPRRKSAGRRSK
jgi:hypothetical protein